MTLRRALAVPGTRARCSLSQAMASSVWLAALTALASVFNSKDGHNKTRLFPQTHRALTGLSRTRRESAAALSLARSPSSAHCASVADAVRMKSFPARPDTPTQACRPSAVLKS